MAKKNLERWFTQYINRSMKYARVGSILLVPGSMIAAYVTYWIIWATLWLGIGLPFELDNFSVGIFSFLTLITLFAWQFLHGSNIEETYRFSGESEAGTVSLNLPRAGGNGLVVLFDPGIAHGFVRVIVLVYLTAPRMLGMALMLHHKAGRLSRMDVPACTEVIRILIRAQGRVPFESFAHKFPDVDLSHLVQPLADVDGVVFLEKDGPGITLAPRFMEEFSEWSGQSSEEEDHPRTAKG